MSQKSKQKDSGGRPTVISDTVLQKLEWAFRRGFSDVQACFHAGIGESTLYDYQKENPGFSERKRALKTATAMLAKELLYEKLKRKDDAKLALDVLQRLEKKTWSLRQEVTGPDGEEFKGMVLYVPEERKD